MIAYFEESLDGAKWDWFGVNSLGSCFFNCQPLVVRQRDMVQQMTFWAPDHAIAQADLLEREKAPLGPVLLFAKWFVLQANQANQTNLHQACQLCLCGTLFGSVQIKSS